jgi:hypothetical protein
MKKLIYMLPITALLITPSSGLAAKGGEKEPADAAHEHAIDKASFKRDENWKRDKSDDKEERKADKNRDKDDNKDESKKDAKTDKDQRKSSKKAGGEDKKDK